MPEYLQRLIEPVLAAIFGWVFISLPKVARRSMSWTVMLSSVGLAGVVGFIAGSVITYLWPNLPTEMVCSLGAIAGAYCDHWMVRFLRISDRAADQIEGVLLEKTPTASKTEHTAETSDDSEPDAEFEEKTEKTPTPLG